MQYVIIPDSAECMKETDGMHGVAVVKIHDDGTQEHDSCWETVEGAAVWVAQLERAAAEAERISETEGAAPEEPPAENWPEDTGPFGGEAMSDDVTHGLDQLERAAALADKVKETLGLLSALAPAEFAEVTDVVQAEEPVEDFTAIASHSTGFSDDPWDGPANEVNVRSPESQDYFANVYAWRDDEADTSVKAAYRFIHHFVASDGRPGGASTIACSAGIGVLNGARGGTTIPGSDRQGVYDHLARHLRDAEREAPALLSQDAYEAAVAESNAELAAELDIPVEDGGLAGLADSDLIAELARRWASDLVEQLRGDETAEAVTEEEPVMAADETAEDATAEDATEFGSPLVEIEVEIRKGGEDEEEEGEGEAEGGYPDGMHKCPMCGGYGYVTVNELEGTCPMCESRGYVAGDEPIATLAAEDEDIAPSAPVEAASDFDWEGVLIVEGIPSGDGRMIAEGALTWRELPIPLMLQTVNAAGHDGAVIAGSIHEIVREGQNIVGRGYFDSGEAGQEARRLLGEGTMRGVSADIDSVVAELVTPEGEAITMEELLFGGVDALEVLVAGRIMGATLTPFPAFQEAFVQVLPAEEVADDAVLIASGAAIAAEGDLWRVPSPLGAWLDGDGDAEGALASLVASAGTTMEVPASPPREWFMPGEMSEPTPFTVHPDGRCYGLVAQWGSCHIGFTDRCVQVPRSGAAYKHFRNKTVLTAEGELVATGPIFMDTVHPNLRLVASDAQSFYADTGCAVADVALYENEHGIVAAGALRPGLSPEQVRRFRGSDVSPDWRTIGGRLEVVGLLAVNVSGFVVESSLVASGGALSVPRGVWDSVAGEVTALVAAGMVRSDESELDALRSVIAELQLDVAELRAVLRPWRAERAAAALRAMTAEAEAAVGSCGCDGGEVCACTA